MEKNAFETWQILISSAEKVFGSVKYEHCLLKIEEIKAREVADGLGWLLTALSLRAVVTLDD